MKGENIIYTFICLICGEEWDENKLNQVICPNCTAYYENADAIKK